MTDIEVSKCRRLLAHDDPVYQQAGLALARSFADYENYALKNIDALAHATNLTTLDLSNTAIESIGPLANLSKLDDLDLRSCSRLVDIDALASLTSLTRLRLQYCSLTQDPDIPEGRSDWTALRSLTMEGCGGFEDLRRLDGLSRLPELTELWVEPCPVIWQVRTRSRAEVMGFLGATTHTVQ